MSIDDLLLEWSYKCEKGYPEIDNPSDMLVLESILKEFNIPVEGIFNELSEEEKEKEDKKSSTTIKDIKSLLDRIKDDQTAIDKIQRYILNRPIESTFFDTLLNKANITDKTVDTSNAPKVIFDILSDGGDLQKFSDYKNPGYGTLGKSGNLIDFFSNSGISTSTLKQLLDFKGTESGRGVGKGEMGLALLLKDVKMAAAGKGDLDWNGKSVEVKGKSARLGGRGRKFTGFKNTALGQLSAKYHKDDGIFIILIPNLANIEDLKRSELLKAVVDFEDEAHPGGDADKYFTENILDNPIKLKQAFTKTLIKSYSNNHNIDHFIWWDSSKKFGDYVSFTPDEADGLVDKGIIGTNNTKIYDLDPTISKP